MRVNRATDEELTATLSAHEDELMPIAAGEWRMEAGAGPVHPGARTLIGAPQVAGAAGPVPSQPPAAAMGNINGRVGASALVAH